MKLFYLDIYQRSKIILFNVFIPTKLFYLLYLSAFKKHNLSPFLSLTGVDVDAVLIGVTHMPGCGVYTVLAVVYARVHTSDGSACTLDISLNFVLH